MTIYSHNNTTPAPLPFRIALPDGRSRTDPTSFTPDELAAAGYVEADAAPDYDPATQHPPQWSGGEWAVADLTAEELAERAHQEWLARVPQSVTQRQARLALLQAGKLDGVQPSLDGLPSPQREAAQIEWDWASVIRRDSPLISAIGGALGLSESQIDDLFIAAASIT